MNHSLSKHPLDSILRTSASAHLVPGVRDRDRFFLVPHRNAVERNRHDKGGRGVRDRLFGTGRGIRQARFLSHHPRPGYSVRNGHEAGKSGAERGGFQRRRGPLRDRGQSFHPRRETQRGHHGDLREQLQLRDDRGPGGRDDTQSGQNDHHPARKPHRLQPPLLAYPAGATYLRVEMLHTAISRSHREALRGGVFPSSRCAPPHRVRPEKQQNLDPQNISGALDEKTGQSPEAHLDFNRGSPWASLSKRPPHFCGTYEKSCVPHPPRFRKLPEEIYA